MFEAVRIERPGMGIKDITHRIAGNHRRLACFERFDAGRVHSFL